MKSIEYLTAMVLAKRSLDLPLGKETILWADLLLAQGVDHPAVKDLICLDPAASKAQTEKAVDDCLIQLKIELVDEKPAHLLLIWAWIQKLLKEELGVQDFLEAMQQLCVDFKHEPVYMQFYLLHCVKKDLGQGTAAIMFHDREVSENNFEQVLRWEIDLFLEQNEREILDFIKVSK